MGCFNSKPYTTRSVQTQTDEIEIDLLLINDEDLSWLESKSNVYTKSNTIYNSAQYIFETNAPRMTSLLNHMNKKRVSFSGVAPLPSTSKH